MAFTNEEKKLLYWQLAVEGMDILNIPEGEYEAAQKIGKYDKFTTYVKEFTEKLLGKRNTGVEFFSNVSGLPALEDGGLKEGWWQQAVDLGKGKIPKNIILPIIYEPTKEMTKAVYDTFMPAYRALSESFARRSIFQWIFNHAQYTAERDAIRGLRGLMMCLTAKTSEELRLEYNSYREKAPAPVRTFEERKAILSRMRSGEEVNVYENEARFIHEEIDEQVHENESVSEIEGQDNNVVIENNNNLENNNLENNVNLENNNNIEQERIVFNSEDVDNSISDPDNSFDDENESVINDDDYNKFFINDDDNKPDDEINHNSNDNGDNDASEQNNEEVKEVQKHRPKTVTLYESAIKPVEFKQEAIAFIGDLLKDANAQNKEDLINVVYDQATDQCNDICNSCDTKMFVYKEEIVDIMESTASSLFNLVHYTLNDSQLNTVDRIVISTKITDYFINKLTPIGFYPEEYSKYGENFLSKYREDITNNFVRDYAEDGVSREEWVKAIDDTLNVLGGNAPQVEEEIPDNQKEEEINNDNDNNENNEPKEENGEVKEEENKVEKEDAVEPNAQEIVNQEIKEEAPVNSKEEEINNDNDNNENNENNDEGGEVEKEEIKNEEIANEDPAVIEPVNENNEPKEENSEVKEEENQVEKEHAVEPNAQEIFNQEIKEEAPDNSEEEEINNDNKEIEDDSKEDEKEEPSKLEEPVQEFKQEPVQEIEKEPVQESNVVNESSVKSEDKPKAEMTQEQKDALNALKDPSYFSEKYNDLIDDGTTLEAVKTEVATALRNAKVLDEEEISNFLENMEDLYDHIPNTYEYNTVDGNIEFAMHTVVEVTIGSAYDFLNNYDVRERGMDMMTHFNLSQEITDIITKRLSPVPFTHGAWNQFANGYGLRSRRIVGSLLSSAQVPSSEHKAYIEKITNRTVEEKKMIAPLPKTLIVSNDTVERLKKSAENNEHEKVEENIQEKIEEKSVNESEIAKEPEVAKEPEPEIEIDEPVNEVPDVPSWIADINNSLKDQCDERVGDSELAAEIRTQMNDIINAQKSMDAGIKKAINQVNKIPSEMVELFEYADVNMRSDRGMDMMARSVFKEAFSRLATCNYELSKRLVMAQKITDVMMKNYSTIAFLPIKFDGYADNYIIRNEAILKEVLSDRVLNLSEKEASDMLDYVESNKNKLLEGFDERENERIEESVVNEGARWTTPKIKESDKILVSNITNFRTRCEEKLDNSDNTEEIKKDFANILSQAGVDSATVEVATDIALDTLLRDLMRSYNELISSPDRLNTAKTFMENIAVTLVASAYKCTSKLISDKANSMYAAQNIADKFNRMYGPVAFIYDNNIINKYSDNYVISDRDNTRKAFDRAYTNEKLSDEEFNKIFATIDERHTKEKEEALARKEAERQRKEAERKEKEELEKANGSEKKEEEEKKVDSVEKKVRKNVEKKPPRNVVEKYERNAKRLDISNGQRITAEEITVMQKECEQSLKDDNLTKYVKAQIENILDAAGVEESKIQKIANSIFDYVAVNMVNTYSNLRTLYWRNEMSPVEIAKYAAGIASSRVVDKMGNCCSNPVVGLLANQKILDVLLKNYSPVAFTNGNLDKSVENYMIEDKKALEYYYHSCVSSSKGFENPEDFYKSVKEAYEEEKNQEIEAKAEQEAKPEENKDINAEIKDNANSDKERIVVNEALEGGLGKEVSQKIEDDSKSVASNKLK